MDFPILVHGPTPGTHSKCPEYTLWFQFSLEGHDCDMELEVLSDIPCAEDYKESTWLEYCMRQSGPDTLIPLGYHYTTIDGFAFHTSAAEFALAHGIAPYQPFSARCGFDAWGPDHNGEYDEENWSEIISVTPLDMTKAARRIDQWRRRFDAHVEGTIKFHCELRAVREADVGSMFLRTFSYFHKAPYWDDMAFPDGEGIELCTSRDTIEPPPPLKPGYFRPSSRYTLLSARDEVGGKLEVARELLYKQIREKFPHVKPEKLPMIGRW